MSGKHEELSMMVAELRAERDRVADELRSTEIRRASLEEKLGAATGDVVQLRADADHALVLVLAREILSIYEPVDPHP